jgi:hypothetical protein
METGRIHISHSSPIAETGGIGEMEPEHQALPSLFAGLTEDDLETLHSLMTDKDIARIRANLGRDVLWVCDDFAEKLGFATKASAYRFATQKKLIKYSLP